MSNESPEYLTVDEAAAVLRCGRDTVTRLIQSGRLPAKDLGIGRHRNYRIKPSDLELLNVKPDVPKQRMRRQKRDYPRLA